MKGFTAINKLVEIKNPPESSQDYLCHKGPTNLIQDRKDNKSLARMKKRKTQKKDHILLSVAEKS